MFAHINWGEPVFSFTTSNKVVDDVKKEGGMVYQKY
jgi:ABC-type arginine transport system ATPase subunit